MSTTFRDHRIARGWRLRDLSDECTKAGVPVRSVSHLSMIERDLVIPRPPLRAVLARLLDLPEGVKYFEREDVSA